MTRIEELSRDPRWSLYLTLARGILYPLAAWLVFKVVTITPFVTYGSDFTPIWNAVEAYTQGRPVYTGDYESKDPHYLYSPGATFLLGPIGLVFSSESIARIVMLWLGMVCVLLALAWTLAMMLRGGGASLSELWDARRSPAFGLLFAVTIVATMLTREPVYTTLRYTNINGFLLLVLVAFVWCCLRTWEYQRANSATTATFFTLMRRAATPPQAYGAAFLLAVAITIKPQFIVLAVVPFLTAQWIVLLVALLFAAAFFAAGWVTMTSPQDYTEKLVPYLAEPRSYANGSLQGMGIKYDWSDTMTLLATVVLLALLAAAILGLLPMLKTDPTAWAFSTIGVSFAAVLMSSGLLQGYYVIWLIPMAMTVLRPASPMHWPLPWLLLLPLFGEFGADPSDWMDSFEWLANLSGDHRVFAWILLPPTIAAWAWGNRRRLTQRA